MNGHLICTLVRLGSFKVIGNWKEGNEREGNWNWKCGNDVRHSVHLIWNSSYSLATWCDFNTLTHTHTPLLFSCSLLAGWTSKWWTAYAGALKRALLEILHRLLPPIFIEPYWLCTNTLGLAHVLMFMKYIHRASFSPSLSGRGAGSLMGVWSDLMRFCFVCLFLCSKIYLFCLFVIFFLFIVLGCPVHIKRISSSFFLYELWRNPVCMMFAFRLG